MAAIVGAAGVTALATHDWWIFPLGAATAAALCFLGEHLAPAIPDGLDFAHQRRAELLLATQADLLAELRRAPEGVRALLAVSEGSIVEVVAKSLGLVASHQEIENHLDSRTEAHEQRQRESLRARAHGEDDPRARERFGRALAAKDDALAHRAELRRCVARLEGELAAIQAALDCVVSQLVRIRSAEARSTFDGESGQLAQLLHALTGNVDALSQSVEQVFNPLREKPK